jgi:hypothetical protein
MFSSIDEKGMVKGPLGVFLLLLSLLLIMEIGEQMGPIAGLIALAAWCVIGSAVIRARWR